MPLYISPPYKYLPIKKRDTPYRMPPIKISEGVSPIIHFFHGCEKCEFFVFIFRIPHVTYITHIPHECNQLFLTKC